MDFAIFKNRRRISENEIDVPFDVAIAIILPPGYAFPRLRALDAVCIERILPADESAFSKEGPVGSDEDRNCLGSRAVGVGERHILGTEIVRLDRGAGRFAGSARGLVVEVVSKDGRGGIVAEERDRSFAAGHVQLLFVGSRLDMDHVAAASSIWNFVHRFLDCAAVAAAIRRDREIVRPDSTGGQDRAPQQTSHDHA